MDNTTPRVSVIVRTLNRPQLLAEALQSIADQAGLAVEAVVVNDGGEAVDAVVSRFSGQLAVQLLDNRDNRGRAAAANQGLGAARGQWLMFLDDDDLLVANALAGLLDKATAAGASAAYADVELYAISETGATQFVRQFGRRFSRQLLLIQNYIPFNALVFRRELLDTAGMLNEELEVFEDWEFLVRLSAQTAFHYFPGTLAHYRSFGVSTIAGNRFSLEQMQAVERQLHQSWWHDVQPEAISEFRAYLHATELAPHAEPAVAETAAQAEVNVNSDTCVDAGSRVGGLPASQAQRRQAVLDGYARLAAVDDYWKGRHLMQLVPAYAEQYPDKAADFFHRYGYEVMGPLFCSCMLGMLERLQQQPVDRVFFLARDGYLLEKLYHVMAPALLGVQSENMTADYLYVSRMSAAPAAIADGMTLEQAQLALNNPKQQGLVSILKAFSLPPDDFAEIADRLGFEPMDAPIADKQDARLQAFVKDEQAQAKIRQLSAPKKALFAGYLASQGFFSAKRVALLDIGWNGTIQHFIASAFSGSSAAAASPGEQNRPQLFGYYFAYCAGIGYRFDQSNRVEGMLYDERRKYLSERSVMAFAELFEQTGRACHTSTVAYAVSEQGDYLPLFRDADGAERRQEQQCDAMVKALQDGVMAFVPAFLAAIKQTGYPFEAIRPFMVSLAERAVVYPRRTEVEHLTRLVHTEDWGHDHVMDFEQVKKTGFWHFWFNIRAALVASHWRYATLRRHAGLIGVMAFRFLRLVKGG